jgi:hypothetical protein
MRYNQIPIHIKRARERAEAFNAKIDAQRDLEETRCAAKAAQSRSAEAEKELEATRCFLSSGIAQHVIDETNRSIAEAIAKKFVENVESYYFEDHQRDIYEIIYFALNHGWRYPPSDLDIENMRAYISLHDWDLLKKFDAIIDLIKDMHRFSGAAERLRFCGAEITWAMKHRSRVNPGYCAGPQSYDATAEVSFTTRVYWDRPLEYACSMRVPMR